MREVSGWLVAALILCGAFIYVDRATMVNTMRDVNLYMQQTNTRLNALEDHNRSETTHNQKEGATLDTLRNDLKGLSETVNKLDTDHEQRLKKVESEVQSFHTWDPVLEKLGNAK